MPLVDFIGQYFCDEITRDDEENINPDKAASDIGHAKMKQNNGKDSDRPKPINIGTIFKRGFVPGAL